MIGEYQETQFLRDRFWKKSMKQKEIKFKNYNGLSEAKSIFVAGDSDVS